MNPAATLLVGIIGAVIAVFGLMVTRAGKISEFRQSWIDAQREDLAMLTAYALKLAGKPKEDRNAKEFLAFDQACQRIRLRENPKKQEWAAVLHQIAELRKRLDRARSAIDVEDDVARIVSSSRWLLKSEWNRVRGGERAYRVVVGFALAWLIGLFVIVARYGFSAIETPSPPPASSVPG